MKMHHQVRYPDVIKRFCLIFVPLVVLAESEQELRSSSLRYQNLSRQFQGVLEGIGRC